MLLSELGHIEACQRLLDERPAIHEEGYLLVPLDAEIEYALGQQGLPFLSGKEYRTPDASRMIMSEEWTSSIFDSSEWSFFMYRDVSFGQLYFPQLQGYTNRLLYYADIVANLITKHDGIARIVVFPSSATKPPRGSCLTDHQMRVLSDVVKVMAAQKGIEALILPSPTTTVPSRLVFSYKRTFFSWGIGILNFFITFTVRAQPKRVRILASDYWKNLAPTLAHMRAGEVFLLDRQEVFNAGWSNVWKFRMRFLHLDAYGSDVDHEEVKHICTHGWSAVSGQYRGSFVFRNFSLEPLIVAALDSIVANAKEEALERVDNAYAVCAALKPHVIMLRATISSQLHFGILAQVARALGIPSVEMQHGLMYFGPGSTGKRHAAGYMGMYGKLVQKEMQTAGDTQSTPLIIGSPRFDVYASLRHADTGASKRVTFLAVAPLVFPEESTDSWDVVDYFAAIAAAVRPIAGAHVLLKLRPGPNRDTFLRATIDTLFKGMSYTVAQFEPLSELYPKADIVISCYSTAALEALQCGKPLIYLGLCPLEKMTGSEHFSPYVQAGAMRMALTVKELHTSVTELAQNSETRRQLANNAIAFLSEQYAFDGKASERAAAFIEKVAHTQHI